jgi:ABC-type transport system involved in multi-copper enzyme maturation permease subunit
MRITIAGGNFCGFGHFEKSEIMNALIKKEIRLLLPSWLAVLTLETMQTWFWEEPDRGIMFGCYIFYFGIIMLAVNSFGREFSLGTFQLLISQPKERIQIWHTKITVLFIAAGLVFVAYFISCDLRLFLAVKDGNLMLHFYPTIVRSDFNHAMMASVAVLFVALTGGLWTTLLLRQITAAIWIAFLAPAALFMLIALVMSKFFNSASDIVVFSVLYGFAGVYIVSGFWLAHRLFHRAQDVAWAGGPVSFSKWRYFESSSKSSASERHPKLLGALIKKEIQLQSISLFCGAVFLALHIAVIVMRKVHGSFERNSLTGTVSEFFWALWLFMPLMIGCTVVAEERRLGVTEGQFCLPVSRRLQFALKFFPAILFGTLLGGFMPLLLERMAAFIGAPNPDFHFYNPSDDFIPSVAIVGLALGLSLAGVYASTLAKNFLQAMGVAVFTIIGCWLFTAFAHHLYSFRSVTWNPDLTIGITILITLGITPWLAYGNFKYFQERGRIWRRNIFGLNGAIIFILVSSTAVYNRVWEIFEPAELAHGPAKFSMMNPPIIYKQAYDDNLLVKLPDGRIWFNQIGYSHPQSTLPNKIRMAINPFPYSIGPKQFINGSNWVSVAVRHMHNWVDQNTSVFGYLETVGIQADGTLWVSDKSDSQFWTENTLTQFGLETNWQALSWSQSASVLLLKKDGTLWRWGTNQTDWHTPVAQWPALRNFDPYRIGTNSDWKNISFNKDYLQKADGSVWSVWMNPTNGTNRILRDTNWDQIDFEKISQMVSPYQGAVVHKNGTLWVGFQRWNKDSKFPTFDTFQVGKETNWVSVVSSAWTLGMMGAIKSDGTLWQWRFNPQLPAGLGVDSLAPTVRLGIHDDWVSITTLSNGMVALAADGGLWFWPDWAEYQYQKPLLKLPKQPELLGNVFGNADF